MDVKAYLREELCNEENRFNMPFLESYIDRCDQHDIIQDRKVIIHYVYPRREAKHIPSVAYMRKIADRINVLLELYQYNNTNHDFTFWVLPTRERRKFPKKGELFGPIHINGAYTYVNSEPPKIFVYRCEEIAKVMIHELCHHLPMHSHLWYGTIRLCREFGLADALSTSPNEAVIEFWAEILHCAFISGSVKNVATLVHDEIQHGLSKTRKLLEHKKKLGGGPWHENTNAFSYIVWRTVLLYFYRDFLKLHMPYDTEKVTDFLITKFHDPQFQRDLKKAPLPRNNDMRMTVHGDL